MCKKEKTNGYNRIASENFEMEKCRVCFQGGAKEAAK